MKAWLKRVAAVGVALLLAGCATEIHSAPVPLAEFPAGELPARQNMTVLVEASADALFHDAAELFADKISDYTGGMLTAEVRTTSNLAVDYAAGEGELAFLDTRRTPGFSPDFDTLTLPFWYKDYDNFTMGLNAGKLLDVLNDNTIPERNIRLLAAFYSGGGYLVAARPVSGGLPELDDWDEDAPAAAALRPGSSLEPLLAGLGFSVAEETDAARRLEQVAENRVFLAEFSGEELYDDFWLEEGFSLVAAGHDLAPVWLLMDDRRYQELSERYQAAIREAVTYLFPVVDSGFLQRESALRERTRAQGATVERSFPALRSAAEDALQERIQADFRQKYIYNIFQDMK